MKKQNQRNDDSNLEYETDGNDAPIEVNPTMAQLQHTEADNQAAKHNLLILEEGEEKKTPSDESIPKPTYSTVDRALPMQQIKKALAPNMSAKTKMERVKP